MGDIAAQTPDTTKLQITEHMIVERIENLKHEQNLALGIIGALFGGMVGAVVWAAIVYFTHYQIGWIAVGVGFLVGIGMRTLGKGLDKPFGVLGGIIALLSVVLGNFLVGIGLLANMYDMRYLETLLSFNYALTLDFMKETFSVMDLLFYAIAVFAGYSYSFRRITKDMLLK